ncbi:MFS transporter [Microbispora sp. H10830]|uniref:MFS transporter n=1 Tax=Microbispora sp. H10830 TaxID=2729109 RepID=UPI002175C5DE|nr:MFS transporter [Microbispora sp. H10830]
MRPRLPGGGPGGRGWVIILSAQFVIMLDASIVTVALPDIQHELGFSASGVQAVVTAYNVAFGGALILGGRLGDIFGRRRFFILGMVGFASSSLLCGLSVDAAMLVACRVLQGFSAAVIAPTALALLADLFPEGAARARAMSRFGIAIVLGFVGGLVLSGLLVDSLGWQSVFYVTVPVGALVAVLIPRLIPPAPSAPGRGRLDVLGAVLITVGVALVVVAPTQGSARGWTSPQCVVSLVAGLCVLVLFLLVERRHPDPLVRLGLFRSGMLRAANVVTLASGLLSGSAYLLVTLYLQEVMGCTPVQVGLIVAPIGLVNVGFGMVLGRLIPRVGLAASLTGATVSAGLLVALVASQVAVAQNLVLFGIVLFPLGMSILATTVGSTLAATAGVTPREQGLAAGVRQTSFQLGIALGVAGLLSLASSRTSVMEGEGIAHRQALAAGYQTALYVLAVLVLMAAIVTFAEVRNHKKAAAIPRAPATTT